jgi:hypothetical protein
MTLDCRSEETWKDIPGYEGLYQASTHGNIRTTASKITSNKRYAVRHWKQRILKPKSPKAEGYRGDLRVTLWKDGKSRDFLVARLVAMTWVKGYDNNLTVNHIDGNYLNNSINNLEWVSLGDNIRKGFETGLYSKSQTKVRLIDENYNYIDFVSLAEANRYLSRGHSYLSNKIKRSDFTAKSLDGEEFRVAVTKVRIGGDT